MTTMSYAVPGGDQPEKTNPPGWPSQAEADLAVQHGWPNQGNDYIGGPGGHRKKSRAWMWAAVAVLSVVIACTGGLFLLSTGAEPKTPTEGFTSMPVQEPDAKKAAPAGEVDAKVGDKVTIEGLQYQVHAVKCGITHVGPKDFGTSPQGSYCRVDLSVTNVSGDPATWDATYNVKTEDSKGRKFSADTTAGLFGNKNEAGWLDQINPGNTVRAFVFFDLPKGAKLKEIEVSSGLAGGEIEIKL